VIIEDILILVILWLLPKSSNFYWLILQAVPASQSQIDKVARLDEQTAKVLGRQTVLVGNDFIPESIPPEAIEHYDRDIESFKVFVTYPFIYTLNLWYLCQHRHCIVLMRVPVYLSM
jgi:hypothetical protein